MFAQYVHIHNARSQLTHIKDCICFLSLHDDGEADQEKDEDIGDLDDLLREEREMEKKVGSQYH